MIIAGLYSYSVILLGNWYKYFNNNRFFFPILWNDKVSDNDFIIRV